MAVRAWIVELVVGLRPWQRAALVVSLCALALPLWFAVGNTDRYRQGQTAVTEGFVDCEWDGRAGARGGWRTEAWAGAGSTVWTSPPRRSSSRTFRSSVAATGRSPTAGPCSRHAVAQYTVAPVGAALVVRIARRRSAYNQETTALMRRYRTTTP